MKKLIELDAALDALREVIVPAEDIGFGDELTNGYNDGIDMAVTVVSGLPTVDAVPVVRCKDCKYNSNTCGNYVNCDIIPQMFGRTVDNFCSRAERRTDERTD